LIRLIGLSGLLGPLGPFGLHVHDLPVTVHAPPVEIIAARCLVDFILRVVSAVNLDHLAGFNLGAALVGQDFRFALTNDQRGFAVGIHLNAINPG
jgi:hypothetical protein